MTSASVLTGLFALAGVALGAVLSGFVTDRLARRSARTRRLEAATRSVAVAIASSDFTWRADFDGGPPGLPTEKLESSQQEAYLRGVDEHLAALREARRDVALLDADGFETGGVWRTSASFAPALDALYKDLLRQSRRRRS